MSTNQRGIIVPLVLFGVTAFLSGIGLFLYIRYYRINNASLTPLPTPNITYAPVASTSQTITDFSSCVAAGNPVQESYPRKCSAFGKVFNEASNSALQVEASNSAQIKKCVVAGCNKEVCVEEKDSSLVTACGYDPEFACYTTAKCEVQVDGNCGWTKDANLKQCLEQAKLQNPQ